MNEIYVQCECGKEWTMDYDSPQISCIEHWWRIKSGENGKWSELVGPYGSEGQQGEWFV